MRFKEFFAVLTDTRCWLRLAKTNTDWDRQLNALLDKPVFRAREHDEDCTFVVVLNGYSIWVANEFYSYGNLYSYMERDPDVRILPSRTTVFRLYNAVEKFKATL